ncbi:MAG: radical SAM protein [Candidatus Margulisbacteria bacterium]|jgi:putative pyruvate formate lyase activating enzyme|nr:radical SAM protein [Candidatus Margulisiibacteriota bacterium]
MRELLKLASPCRLCPRRCGVNRLAGEKGFCGAGNEMLVSYIGVHYGEEPPISGRTGSGAVFFGHCTMSCVFCQNWQISQTHCNLRPIRPTELAAEFLRLQNEQAHNINLVSPTQYAPWIIEALTLAKRGGLTIPVVYNTNGYENPEVLALLADHVDIYLPDLKYADNASAARYAQTANYAEHGLAAVKFMLRQKGLLQTSNDIAARGIIVRHLALPGLVKESKEILTALYSLNPQIQISLMSQYAPQHRAKDIPELSRRLSAGEYNEVVEYAVNLGLENIWTQELASQDILAPDFGTEKPFAAVQL